MVQAARVGRPARRIAGGRSGGVRVRPDCVGPARRRDPDESPGYRLREFPAVGLFHLVMEPAQRSDVAFARATSLVEGGRVVLVSATGRPPAAGERPAGLADLPPMPQPPL